MLTVFEILTSALLFFLVFGFVANTAHTWLEFGAGIRRPIAVTLAVIVGAAAGAGLCWLTSGVPDGTCVDYAPGIYGTC